MNRFKETVRSLLKKGGYRLTRYRPANRFDAMQDSLTHLKSAGFNPKVVIDGGANVGEWARLALVEFPHAHLHLIEPLPNCLPFLEKVAQTSEHATMHQTAISSYGVSSVDMTFLGEDGTSTGAQVSIDDEADKWESISLPATNLDTLFSETLTEHDHPLLKLDLQGHEIPALKGAKKILSKIEVILAETQLFTINDNNRPTFEELIFFLHENNFAVYDVACLHARKRDNRAMCGDVIFVRRSSSLLSDNSWT